MLPTINLCFHYINLKVPWLNNLPFYLSIDYAPSFLLITYLGKNQGKKSILIKQLRNVDKRQHASVCILNCKSSDLSMLLHCNSNLTSLQMKTMTKLY